MAPVIRTCLLALVVVSGCALSGCALSGCEREPERPAAPAQTAPAPIPADEPAGEELAVPPATPRIARMHERFETVDLARSALQRGDLVSAQTVISTITFRFEIDLPEAARRHGDTIPQRALDVVRAEDLRSATAAFARLVGTCGGCHAAAGTTWTWPEEPIPDGDELRERMERHAWANERMWEALLVASPERFDRASEVLAVAPFTGETAPDEERPEGVRAIEERLRDAARSATTARSMEDRAAIYGTVLGSCSECHARLRALDR